MLCFAVLGDLLDEEIDAGYIYIYISKTCVRKCAIGENRTKYIYIYIYICTYIYNIYIYIYIYENHVKVQNHIIAACISYCSLNNVYVEGSCILIGLGQVFGWRAPKSVAGECRPPDVGPQTVGPQSNEWFPSFKSGGWRL